ncbi:hypothetical protein HIM_00786 [Hirsutella minnesotensis 3608]|nr:hypothetical protein HIM_00786 [Hirsutella minnesotensis 3608]
MPLIASKTIITSVSLFHLTIAYFFLTNPRALDDQTIVYVLGTSMGMPTAHGFDAPSPALAFLGAVLALFGLCDLVALSMPEELSSLYYWGVQAPVRSMFAMGLVFYTYFLGPSSPVYGAHPPRYTRPSSSPSSPSSATGAGGPSSLPYAPSSWGGDGLKNRVFFTFIFVEMISWFWIWVTLREERHGVVERMRKQHARPAK